jgi:hypothetical protein
MDEPEAPAQQGPPPQQSEPPPAATQKGAPQPPKQAAPKKDDDAPWSMEQLRKNLTNLNPDEGNKETK